MLRLPEQLQASRDMSQPVFEEGMPEFLEGAPGCIA